MNVGILRTAFIDKSHVDIPREEYRLRKMKSVPEKDNSDVAEKGSARLYECVKAFTKNTYPSFPDEAIKSITSYLTSETEIAKIAQNIGIADMIIASMYPYPDDVLYRAFCALVETIASQRTSKSATNFIQDFVCSQLISEDVLKIWNPDNPELVLNKLLANQNKEPAEPRLVYSASPETILPAITVGFFSNKQFIGSGCGETIDEAREEAALNCLREVLNYNWECASPITFTIDRIDVKE